MWTRCRKRRHRTSDGPQFADLSSYRLSGAARLVSFEGRTGVQCACVRIGSILANAGEKMHDAGAIAVATASERARARIRAPSRGRRIGHPQSRAEREIADHTFAVAQAFSRFYTECPVLAADTEAERDSRLALCELTRAILAKELWLLGIDAPERM
jgi:arginyl-tRNA synthetase